ncbi:uncharacterized protein LOC131008547 [Salvia miltiorrhiza]|uniref:uncharacterized protein LOC131008547 n=1 Tax=Salvia miltiorrhiza TaxID=226208 RepID=UPI0025AD348C|nr:uncharacterized protein LOC131008547 [Salvia miltiorrhiza]XP_057791442.1 uncharacterized protein LOC131008547 [Salvia miltiorrhiza]
MISGSKRLLCYLAILLFLLIVQSSRAHLSSQNGMKADVFLSPVFVLGPGSVSNKFYYGIDFPRGHIAIKKFNAEVVDEEENPVPLHETYLHHWVVVGYRQRKGESSPEHFGDTGLLQYNSAFIRNSGMCDNSLVQYFGLGSETRKTATDVPDPYGIEVGNPADVPAGYEERWLLNVHAIDTRGAEDKLGCTECRCDLYNVTADQYGDALPPDYIGGMKCCHDGVRCRVKEGFQGKSRSLYLKYTVTYMDWDASIVPVQIYIFDVTDIWRKADESTGETASHYCLVEYDVEACPIGTANDGCIHTKSLTVSLPTGGDVIYGVGHQHSGGFGSTLFGEGGRVICSSVPTYGTGHEAGNEAGYIVGMSTCYPSPGSVKISAGETLTLISNYSSAQRHTGVMGLFYILIADSSAKPRSILHSPAQVHRSVITSYPGWLIALFGVGLVLAVVLVYNGRNERDEGYEEI